MKKLKALKFFEGLYHFITGTKNFLYEKNIIAPLQLNVPVISVGNLSFGGVGKTPCIILLAEELSKTHRLAIITRSYKASLKNPKKVLLNIKQAPATYGDEACLIKSKLPQCDVWSGPQKYLTAQACLVDKPEIILLDDGFSHRNLSRNFDLVLIDATEGFETYLREAQGNLKRANAILITKTNIADQGRVEKIIQVVLKIAPHLKNNIFTSSVRTDLNVDKSYPLFVFCGLARPESFLKDLKNKFFTIAAQELFADHYTYTAKDQKRIFAKFLDLKNIHRQLNIVTTEKDAVKIDDKDLQQNLKVTQHKMHMESELMGVLIEKIRSSF